MDVKVPRKAMVPFENKVKRGASSFIAHISSAWGHNQSFAAEPLRDSATGGL